MGSVPAGAVDAAQRGTGSCPLPVLCGSTPSAFICVHPRFNYFLIAITEWSGICRAMNVLFHYTAGPDLAARLAAVPGLRITICPEDDDAALARTLPETDVLWHVLKRCTEAMIAAAPRLKLIQKIGVGVNTINLEAAIARGI